MKVKANFPHGGFGFYNSKRVRHGDEFEVEQSHFSERWMLVLTDTGPKKRTRRKKVSTPVIIGDNDSSDGEE